LSESYSKDTNTTKRKIESINDSLNITKSKTPRRNSNDSKLITNNNELEEILLHTAQSTIAQCIDKGELATLFTNLTQVNSYFIYELNN